MDYFNPGVYFFNILFASLAAIFIFIFFRLFKYLIQFFKLPRATVEFINKYFPVTELIAWIFYLFWCIQYFFSRGLLITFVPLLVFIGLTLFLIWFALKDIIAGIVFKSLNFYKLNDTISVDNVSGKIVKLGQRMLQVENISGQIMSIPYSKLSGSFLIKSHPSQTLISHNFVIKIPLDDGEDIFRKIEDIKTEIMLLPWSSQKKEPKIYVREENRDFMILALTLYSLDETYIQRTGKHLRDIYRASILPSNP